MSPQGGDSMSPSHRRLKEPAVLLHCRKDESILHSAMHENAERANVHRHEIIVDHQVLLPPAPSHHQADGPYWHIQGSGSEMRTVFGATPPKGKMMSKASPHYYRLRKMRIRALSVNMCSLELESSPTMGDGEGSNRGRSGRGRGRGRPPGRGRGSSRGGSARTRTGQRRGRGRGRGRGGGMHAEENESSEETPEQAAIERATREYKILIFGPINHSEEEDPAKYPAMGVYQEIRNQNESRQQNEYGIIKFNRITLRTLFLMDLEDEGRRSHDGNRRYDLESYKPIRADFLFLTLVHFTCPTMKEAWTWLRVARDCNCKVPKLIGFACTGPAGNRLTENFINRKGNCIQVGFQKMVETLEERYIGCFDEHPIFINLTGAGHYGIAAEQIVSTVMEHLD